MIYQQSELNGLQKRVTKEQLLKSVERYSPSPQAGGVQAKKKTTLNYYA
jgi:hypothetical protein